MKTAEDYFIQLQHDILTTICDPKKQTILILRAYAKQVAEQALKDASENVWKKDSRSNDLTKGYILNTQITLP